MRNMEFESLGKWARQLYAESLGKEFDRSGKEVRAGITPIVSIGSTDLHSMAQLYLGGPKDKFTVFVRIPEHSTLKVPEKGMFTELIPSIKGVTPDTVMDAIYKGTLAAYNSHKLPHAEIGLPAVSLYGIGMFFELQMLTIMYLGELMHLNVFDQPNVEDYKKVTKQILDTRK